MSTETPTTETHAVYARTVDGDRVRVSDPSDWNGAQYQWRCLDEARRARQFPHVLHFEVRSTSDPAYAGAPVSLSHGEPVFPTRGFTRVEDAARRAWKLWQGEQGPHGPQGTGGWYYWHNGRTAAQGLHDLARLAKARGIVVRGADGRWYPLVSEL